MSHGDTQLAPVPVHVDNLHELMAGAASPVRHKVRQGKAITKNLTAAIPVIDVAPYDETRLYILMQVGGNNIVLCTDLSQAQDPNNQVATVPNPDGFLLTAGNTLPYKIEGCGRLWAVGNSYPAQLTMWFVHESP
jgi:hypothetical protein